VWSDRYGVHAATGFPRVSRRIAMATALLADVVARLADAGFGEAAYLLPTCRSLVHDEAAWRALGSTVLLRAARSGSTAVVAKLLRLGAAADARLGPTRAAAIVMAARRGHADVVSALVDGVAEESRVDAFDRAVLHGNEGVALLLLPRCANAMGSSREPARTLETACCNVHSMPRVVRALLERFFGDGSEPLSPHQAAEAMHAAALWGHAEVVDLLMAYCARRRVDTVAALAGSLYLAATNGRVGIARKLAALVRPASVATALFFAAQAGERAVVAALLSWVAADAGEDVERALENAAALAGATDDAARRDRVLACVALLEAALRSWGRAPAG
jgi:ankyrin repeat protein